MNEEKKPEKQASFFEELGSFLRPYRGRYGLSVVLSLLSVAAGIGAYACVGGAAALLFAPAPTWEQVWPLAAGAVGCKLLHTLLLNVSTWISHGAAYDTLRDIRLAVEEKFLRMPMGYFEKAGSGRLKTMLVDRIEGMEKTLAHMLPELTADLLGPLACVVWMFFIDWRLALVCLGWIMLGFGVTSGMMKNYEEKYAGQIARLKGMNQAVVEFVNGIEVIKNFGRTDACYQKYEDGVYGHAAYNVNWQKETQRYTSLGMAIAPFSVFPVLLLGLFLYSRGSLEAGPLFLTVLLTFGIFGPIMNASNYFDQLAGMGTNAKEIKEVLDYTELVRGEAGAPASADIVFDGVSFGYTPQEEVLHGIDLEVPAGSMLALVGPSGSGKSTIAKLLAGFWDATAGEIRLGGQPLSAYSQETLNRMIAFVDQDTFLFDETIGDNIRIGCPEASDEAVEAAAGRAGCHEFIAALPEGYHTRAGAAGSRLSGGEKQRIAIARAMMKDAPILILDEATASTDPENEAAIQQALTAAAKGKTLIVVAHRLATVQHADRIAYVQDGRVLAVGTHAQLLAACPAYAAMWRVSEVNHHA